MQGWSVSFHSHREASCVRKHLPNWKKGVSTRFIQNIFGHFNEKTTELTSLLPNQNWSAYEIPWKIYNNKVGWNDKYMYFWINLDTNTHPKQKCIKQSNKILKIYYLLKLHIYLIQEFLVCITGITFRHYLVLWKYNQYCVSEKCEEETI